VTVHLSAAVSRLEGDGRVQRVILAGEQAIDADLVVGAIGVAVNRQILRDTSIRAEKAILTDEHGQTNVPGIYAAGDCCSYDSVVHGRRIHVEHWDVAMQQGMHAARGMLGEEKDYDVVPYFFSDLADWASLEYVGPARDWDKEVWRGDRDGGEFSVWYEKRTKKTEPR